MGHVSDAVSVLIVDDHASYSESLRDVLGRREGIVVTGTATTVAEAERLAEESSPQVVLMDQKLPDGSGTDAAARILARRPTTAIVMLTSSTNADDLLDAVEAGVCGYLAKTVGVKEVADAIARAAAGEMLIPGATLMDLLRRKRERDRARQSDARVAGSLTPREREVLRSMASARDTAGIAEDIGVSHHTARSYVQAVMEKLGVHTRLAAVLRAQELDLLS
jgi:DNA-binding NarL/FixJ family response regulator